MPTLAERSAPPADTQAWGALAVTLALWAASFPVIRVVQHHYPPGAVALGRALGGGLALALYALAVRVPLPRCEDLPRLGAAGLLAMALYHTCLNYGLQTVQAGPASMMVNVAPVFTALLAAAFLGVLPIGAACVSWAYVLARMDSARATSWLYLLPVGATLIVWLWLGEVPSVLSLTGGALALGGVALVNLRSRP